MAVWLIWCQLKLPGERQQDTGLRHKAGRQTFKGSLVLKLNLPWNTEVTSCHFSPSTRCPTVVRCQGDFYSRTFHVISFHGDCVPTSCQYVLPLCYFPRGKRGIFVLTRLHLLCLFSWKSIPNHFFHPPLLLSLGKGSSERWAHKLCFSITVFYIYPVTHSSLLGASKYNQSHCAAPLEQMGLRAKAVQQLFALFFLFVFCFYIQHTDVWNYALSCIDPG